MFKLGLIQTTVTKDKEENARHVCQLIRNAVKDGADIVVLPECFNCPYSTSLFAQYAEEIPGATNNALSSAAKECGIYIFGGSIPERDGHKLYNSCPVFDPSGSMVAKYRKLRPANTFVPGQLMVKESDVFMEGDTPAIIDTAWCSVGVGICHDL